MSIQKRTFRAAWLLLALCGAPAVGDNLQTPADPAVPETVPAATQPSTTQPTSQPAVDTQPAEVEATEGIAAELNPDNLHSKIAQTEASTELADTVKAELLAKYQQALEQVQVAQRYAEKIAELKAKQAEAPQRLEEVRAELDAPRTPVASPDPNMPLDTLTAELATREQALTVAQDRVKALDTEAQFRADRTRQIPELLAGAAKRIEEINKDLATPPTASVSPAVGVARRTLLQARRRAVEREVDAYEAELSSYRARSELLAARRDLAARTLSRAKEVVDAWQAAVRKKREADVARQEQQATAALAETPAALRSVAETNRALVDALTEVQPKITEAEKDETRVRETFLDLGTRLEALQKNIDAPALKGTIGPQLRQARARLQSLQDVRRRWEQSKARYNEVGFLAYEYGEQRKALGDLDAAVERTLEDLDEELTPARRAALEPELRKLLESRRETVVKLTEYYNTYQKELQDLVAAQGELVGRVEQFRAFINEYVLWIRSAAPLHQTRWPQDAERKLNDLGALGTLLVTDVRTHIPGYGIGVAVVLALLVVRRRMRLLIIRLRDKVMAVYADSYKWTVQVLVATIVMSLPLPLLLLLMGQRLSAVAEEAPTALYELGQALGLGFRAAGAVLFNLLFIRNCCRVRGLAESHFRWPNAGVAIARRNLTWLAVVFVVAAVVVGTAERYPDAAWRDTLGRLAFMGAMVALLVFAARILHPTHGAVANWVGFRKDAAVFKLRWVWYVAVLALPVLLIGLAGSGFYYTAIALAKRLTETVYVILGVAFLHALAFRWLYVAQRKLAIAQAKKRRAAALAKAAEGTEQTASEAPPLPDEKELDLVSIGEQTRKLLRAGVMFGLVLGFWYTWVDLLPALDFLQEVHLWSYTVERAANAEGAAALEVQYITLQHALAATVILIATFLLAKDIPGLLEIALLQRLPLDMGGRFAVTAIARYAIFVVGVVSAFSAIGIGWSKVQWLVAAVSVGLGFGLQEIFANFVSGIVMLFERPIRIGDTVTVGNVSGTVTRMRIRATTITDWDRKELIIPNKEFITGQVINWSLTDQVLRIVIPVGIAYGSDTEKAEKVLYRVADKDPIVMKDPPPRVLFLGFGDSSLSFELRVYIPSIEHLLTTKHNLHKAIDAAFREAGIEIAFPQRDIHVRSIKAALPVEGRDNVTT
jgi:potassium efflux system protein